MMKAGITTITAAVDHVRVLLDVFEASCVPETIRYQAGPFA
jgi:hypothetical protein